jgi:hypothetical protein
MRLALPAPAMRRAFAGAAPQPRRQHPPPQRVVMDGDAVFARQMLGRQGRPKPHVHRPAVLLPHRCPTHAPVRPSAAHDSTRPPRSGAQSLRPFRLVPPRQTLRLAIAHGQQPRGRSQTQSPRLTRLNTSTRVNSLALIHVLPNDDPFEVISLGDISISLRRRHYHFATTVGWSRPRIPDEFPAVGRPDVREHQG